MRLSSLPAAKVVLALLVIALLGVTGTAGAQSDLEQARRDLAAIEDRVEELQAEADAATAEFHEAESELGQIELEIELLADDLVVAESGMSSLRGELRSYALDAYTGTGSYGQSLKREDLNAAARVDFLSDFVTGSNTEIVEDYRAAAADLATTKSELAERETLQLQTVEKLGAAQEQVYANLESVSEELDRYLAIVASLEEQQRIRLAEEARLRQVKAAIEAAATPPSPTPPGPTPPGPTPPGPTPPGPTPPSPTPPSPTPPSPAPEPPPPPSPPPPPPPPPPAGGIVCPVAGPVSFSDTWGAPRSGGRRHKGVDMLAANGVPVVAPVAGRVEHRGNSIGGESFHLYAPNGDYYFGTHLSGYAASGDVPAGTVIGYVGATGNATTPHLHFEYHPGGYGNAVNPYPYVRAAC